MKAYRKWKQYELDEIKLCIRMGMTTREIAAKFKTSRNSIIGLSFRNGWRHGMPASKKMGRPSTKWKPISTAPENVRVLLYTPPTRAMFADEYEIGFARQGNSKCYTIHGYATHWKPLPPPPEAAP